MQISIKEQQNLQFARLDLDATSHATLKVSGVRPVLLPAFFYAGQVGGEGGGEGDCGRMCRPDGRGGGGVKGACGCMRDNGLVTSD